MSEVVYIVHLVDYDGGRIGRTWGLYLFRTRTSADARLKLLLDDRTRYPEPWESRNTYENGLAQVPDRNRLTPVWWNTSYGHSQIAYITTEPLIGE